MLILSNRAENIERIVHIIERIDKAGDSEIEVIPLQYASATEMVRILNSIHGAGAGAEAGTTPLR